jgi:glycosyltransferase involved in cell wall biosynthesis
MLHDSIADADVVLCVSEAVRRLVLTKFPHEDRVWILPNRVNFDVMRLRGADETAELSAKYPFKYPILHVGRRSVQKNLDNLIKALRILGPDYCLIASGRGPLEEYERLATEQGVRERCFFLDAIPNEDLPRYFSWARCMCNPSRWEGMSIVLIEALASGAVLVASDIPEISESVHHRENGLLIQDYENAGAIADMIRLACTDEEVRRTVRGQARKSVEQFERTRIDTLEAGYYEKTLSLNAAGAFHVPFGTRIQRSLSRRARNVLPGQVKQTLRPLIGR